MRIRASERGELGKVAKGTQVGLNITESNRGKEEGSKELRQENQRE